MIQAFQGSQTTSGSSTERNLRRRTEFRGREVPTYLRFAGTDPLRVRPGIPSHVELLTDAADSVVKDRRTQFQMQSNSPGIQIGSWQGESGRWRVSIIPSSDLVVGSRIELRASIAQQYSWRFETEQPRRLIVEAPPPPFIGSEPPKFVRFRSQNGTVHVRQGGARIALVSDARNDLFESGAILTVTSPDPESLPVLGWAAPRDGDIRVRLQVPRTAALGPVGKLTVVLSLPNGSYLTDSAELTIEPPVGRGGTTSVETRPNYAIRDVREVVKEEDETSWSEMPRILEGSDPWNRDDVGAYLETGDETQRKLTFYLNADNRQVREVEMRIAQQRTETAVDSFRQMHRTLLCFHLYGLATTDGPGEGMNYDQYRREMIRIGQTLLYTQREFSDWLGQT